MGALNTTESGSDVAVKRDICEPMWRSKAARRGRVKGLFGGGMLVLMRAASWLSKGRWSESLESGSVT